MKVFIDAKLFIAGALCPEKGFKEWIAINETFITLKLKYKVEIHKVKIINYIISIYKFMVNLTFKKKLTTLAN